MVSESADLSLLRTDYYPGFRGWDEPHEAGTAPIPGGRLATFADGDETRSWQLDFHYPMGIMPLSHTLLDAVYSGARCAAAALPVAASRGLSGRLVGPHVYTAGIDISSPEERAERAAAAAAELTAYPRRFNKEWTEQANALHRGFDRLQSVDPRQLAGPGLVDHFDETVRLFASGWQLHFDVMYRLLAINVDFQVLCRALGISDADGAALLPSGETAIRAADLAMWRLAVLAREAGLTSVFTRHADARLLDALQRHDKAAAWLIEFEAFTLEYGQRTEHIVDVSGASWAEDPVRPLLLIRAWVLGQGADPHRATANLAHVRNDTVESIRTRLGPADRRTFDQGLDIAMAANFAWWNEEHNSHIDLRLHLPVRRAGGALAVQLGGDPDDGLFLFADEVRHLALGGRSWAEFRGLIDERRRWRASWLLRRSALPRTVGSERTAVLDPVMREVIGVRPAQRTDPAATTLMGMPVSHGTARGRARIVRSEDDLDRIERGDVLVCEASSAGWTPAFARVTACVCDSGGALTHAAIICREYSLPCVCAVGIATRVIADGDIVEVNGTTGAVTLIRDWR